MVRNMNSNFLKTILSTNFLRRSFTEPPSMFSRYDWTPKNNYEKQFLMSWKILKPMRCLYLKLNNVSKSVQNHGTGKYSGKVETHPPGTRCFIVLGRIVSKIWMYITWSCQIYIKKIIGKSRLATLPCQRRVVQADVSFRVVGIRVHQTTLIFKNQLAISKCLSSLLIFLKKWHLKVIAFFSVSNTSVGICSYLYLGTQPQSAGARPSVR